MKIPKAGDYIKFDFDYHLMHLDEIIPEGSICRVAKVVYFEKNGWAEEVDCILYLAVDLEDSNRTHFVRINYGVFSGQLTILPEGKATELLYARK